MDSWQGPARRRWRTAAHKLAKPGERRLDRPDGLTRLGRGPAHHDDRQAHLTCRNQFRLRRSSTTRLADQNVYSVTLQKMRLLCNGEWSPTEHHLMKPQRQPRGWRLDQ